MDTPDGTIEGFDVYTASDREYAALHEFDCQMRAERRSDDPPLLLDEFTARNRNIPRSLDVRTVLARLPNGTVVGQASTFIIPGDENPHLLQAQIEVLAPYRRRGMGKQLLQFVAEEAKRQGRSLIIGQTHSTIPDGAAFAQRIGAQRGIEGRTNQLVLAEVDWDLVRRWRKEGETRASAFELHFNQGPYPDEILPAMVDLINIVNNDAPRDDLDLADVKLTPEHLREWEQSSFAAGGKRWTLYARERKSGAFAGYTEIYWHPNRPHIANQGGTGVFPRYRRRGLGRWLKAAMLERLRADLPAVQFIRTGNANSNAPMLRINEALGFRPYIDETIWQIKVEDVLRYLNR